MTSCLNLLNHFQTNLFLGAGIVTSWTKAFYKKTTKKHLLCFKWYFMFWCCWVLLLLLWWWCDMVLRCHMWCYTVGSLLLVCIYTDYVESVGVYTSFLTAIAITPFSHLQWFNLPPVRQQLPYQWVVYTVESIIYGVLNILHFNINNSWSH